MVLADTLLPGKDRSPTYAKGPRSSSWSVVVIESKYLDSLFYDVFVFVMGYVLYIHCLTSITRNEVTEIELLHTKKTLLSLLQSLGCV